MTLNEVLKLDRDDVVWYQPRDTSIKPHYIFIKRIVFGHGIIIFTDYDRRVFQVRLSELWPEPPRLLKMRQETKDEALRNQQHLLNKLKDVLLIDAEGEM
jgi:hypothetical protein